MVDASVVNVPEKFKNHPLFTNPVCGMNFGFMSKRGYFEKEEVLKQPELMAKTGVNFVTVNMNFCLENFASRHLFLDFEYSIGELELLNMVKKLHENGIKVLFKPCMTPLDGMWMGSVDFPTGHQIQTVNIDYWKEFFESFIMAECYFAELATKIEADALLIGCEYKGLEAQGKYWEEIIELVRERYDGPISYEITPTRYDGDPEATPDENLYWFNKLDFLSYSFYPPAAPEVEPIKDSPHFTVEEMMDYLSVRKETVKRFSKNYGNKPVVFTEYGTRSAHGCIIRPWDAITETYYDGEEQANFMEASLKTFWDLPQWMGMFWWKWDETQNRPMHHDEEGVDKGFTIQDKPAEDVLKRWFLK